MATHLSILKYLFTSRLKSLPGSHSLNNEEITYWPQEFVVYFGHAIMENAEQ